MRQWLLCIGCIIMALALPAHAAHAKNIFDTYYNEAASVLPKRAVSLSLKTFVVREMLKWRNMGIVLQPDDIDRAMKNDLSSLNQLCTGRTDAKGKPLILDLSQGSITCATLQRDIVDFVDTETQIWKFGDDLLAAAVSDRAMSDEAHLPVSVGHIASTFDTLWTGTGGTSLPWPENANEAVAALEAALNQESSDDAVWRFHFGYFRQKREDDPLVNNLAPLTEAALKNLATVLGIKGDPLIHAEYLTPLLKVDNIALWVRGDDLGINWIYPTHVPRRTLQPAGTYPTYAEFGDVLSYPYAYAGTGSLSPAKLRNVRSPLCSGRMGSQGYLCRTVVTRNVECAASGSSAITLAVCDDKKTETATGPPACTDESLIFVDRGVPIDALSADKDRAPLATICSPEQRVLYEDNIANHACFISRCMAQSFSGHTLIGRRNTTLVNESTDPYVDFRRNDPQIGLYAEMSGDYARLALPPYLGHMLVRDMETALCAQNGLPPHPLGGFCAYRTSRAFTLPTSNFGLTAILGSQAHTRLSNDNAMLLDAAMGAGARLSLDQGLPIQRKMISALAQAVKNIAAIFKDLSQAKITQQLCPWIGAPKDNPS